MTDGDPKAKVPPKTNKTLVQFIKFSLVGLSNTLLSEGIYVILVYFKMHYIPASFIGFSLSTVNAFYWNSRYVFTAGEKQSPIRLFFRTYLAYLGSYLLSAALLFFWIDLLHISRYMDLPAVWCTLHGLQGFDREFFGEAIAAFLNLLITVPLNFFVNKFWAYREKRQSSRRNFS